MEGRNVGTAMCVAILCGAAWTVMGPFGLLLVMILMMFAAGKN